MIISACGLICNDCNFFNNPCTCCYKLKGKTFWAKDHTNKGVCPLFDCAINIKQFSHCGDCAELPCEKYYDLKDPNISKKEHIESIKNRVAFLRDKN